MSVLGSISRRHKHIIEWSVQDFILLSVEGGKKYYSPEFSFADENWVLSIYSNGSKRKDTEIFDLCLWRNTFGPSISMEFTLGVKTVDGKIDFERYFEKCFRGLKFFESARKLFCRSELLERKSVLLPSDTLTLVFRIKSLGFTEFTSTSISSVALPKSKILQDFKQLFLRKENCDVMFRVKDQEIHAHQAILSARSSILASTVRHNMKEKTTGFVDIKDFNPRSFSDFLGFLYYEDVDLSEKNVFSLLAAANKYDVMDLGQKCLEFIKDNLSVDTFCNTMTLALLHTEKDVISLAIDFFITNVDNIIETVHWQSFIADSPTRRNEFIKFLAYNKKQKVKSLSLPKKRKNVK